jgi:Flp pilus assembly pilin Flp
MNILKNFLRDEQGQDLIEYTLLLAFVALASAALFINAGASINTIWSVANVKLNQAASAANSGGS